MQVDCEGMVLLASALMWNLVGDNMLKEPNVALDLPKRNDNGF